VLNLLVIFKHIHFMYFKGLKVDINPVTFCAKNFDKIQNNTKL